MFPNWAKNILFLLVFMISSLVLVIIIDGLLSGTDLTPLNTVIEQTVTHMRTPFLTTFFIFITRLGDPFVLSFATALISILLVVRGRHYDAVLFITSLLISVILLLVLKNTFQIARPSYNIINTSEWSFPSGHVTVTTAFFFLLVYSFFGYMKTLRGKIILVAGSFIGAILIWFSRLYLGAHWALDILGGIALGLLSVSFTILAFNILIEGRRSLKSRMHL